MRRLSILTYGAACYALFLVTFLYAIGFVADFAVPHTLDHGPSSPLPTAIGIDVALLGLFAAQHSGMARRGFKRWLTRWLPSSIERSTFVLFSSLALILLFWQWRPLPAPVWQVETPLGVWALHGLSAAGWLLVLTGTFVISHFDLFGLRQVWLRARGQPYAPPPFEERSYYRIIRHPLMLGFIVAFWATPTMTAGHLLFAAATTGYILLALQLEERDLVAEHGEAYREYRRQVPMLCPWPRPGRTPFTAGSRET